MKLSLALISIIFLVGCNYEKTETTKISEDGIEKNAKVQLNDTSIEAKSNLKTDGTIAGTDFSMDFFFENETFKNSVSFVKNESGELINKVIDENSQKIIEEKYALAKDMLAKEVDTVTSLFEKKE